MVSSPCHNPKYLFSFELTVPVLSQIPLLFDFSLTAAYRNIKTAVSVMHALIIRHENMSWMAWPIYKFISKNFIFRGYQTLSWIVSCKEIKYFKAWNFFCVILKQRNILICKNTERHRYIFLYNLVFIFINFDENLW